MAHRVRKTTSSYEDGGRELKTGGRGGGASCAKLSFKLSKVMEESMEGRITAGLLMQGGQCMCTQSGEERSRHKFESKVQTGA